MNWMAKTRLGSSATGVVPSKSSKPGPTPSNSPPANLRTSNGLKEFLWLISDVRQGRILDLGPIWQSTLNFFLDKGYRVSAEDLLRTWKDFLTGEEERLRSGPAVPEAEKASPAMLADKFLETSLQYPEKHFHGVLAWDLLDYFDPEVSARMMERLSFILHPGGALLAQFHSRAPERFHRYRVVDGHNVELVPSATIAVHAHVFQNREILTMFGQFRSSKTFVGRDQVREGLFLK